MLTVNNLTYQYGAHRVLDDVSLYIPAGQIAALVGRNGAGKSTLLRCLAGWTMPSHGTVELGGRSVSTQERAFRELVTFVPDTPDFYDELTAWEHLQFVAQLNGIPCWQARGNDLLDAFGLGECRMSFPFTFSRGMRYKLALCMALLLSPELLLLDEPFGPLDDISSRELWQFMLRQREQGKSVIFSSHILMVGREPDCVLLLNNQRISILAGPETPDLAALLSNE